MTIDERLEKLTERHEALAQSVELLVAQGRETDRRLDALSANVDRVSAEVGRVSAEVGRVSAEVSRVSAEVSRVSADVGLLSGDIGRVSADVSNLLTIVTIQNERIKRLEDKAGYK